MPSTVMMGRGPQALRAAKPSPLKSLQVKGVTGVPLETLRRIGRGAQGEGDFEEVWNSSQMAKRLNGGWGLGNIPAGSSA